jgi:hypothetical protein
MLFSFSGKMVASVGWMEGLSALRLGIVLSSQVTIHMKYPGHSIMPHTRVWQWIPYPTPSSLIG